MNHKENDHERFERYRKELVGIIQKTIPHCTIYLFGSRARNQHRSGADIDLALDAGHPIPFNTLLKIYGEIEHTTLPLEVDLVDIHNVTEEMLHQIHAEKIKWAA